MSDFNFKDNYDVYDLVEIVKVLRSENGCPWDKVQTHQSIRKDFLEEVYEVLEAIDMDSVAMLREELGDVLLQVAFHCVIETEKNNFDLNDVADEVCKKLIVRHPHVFGDIKVKDADEVLKNWDSIKKETKGQKTFTETLESVPKVFPALMRGQKLGKRATRAGLESTDINEVLNSLENELGELKKSVSENDSKLVEEKLGDLIFNCCSVARVMNLDAEESLQKANDRYIERFRETEKLTQG